MVLLTAGCTRAFYRKQADTEVSDVLAERASDPRWAVPPRGIWPDPHSRLADATKPDRGPLPQDDPAAHDYQLAPYRFRGWKGYERRGIVPIEQSAWLTGLPRDANGAVPLGPATVMRLALIHSRDYQTEIEKVYLAALRLTFERFELDTQVFAGTGANYFHAGTGGSAGNETNTLTVPSDVTVRQNLASGGQLLANFANQFVWEFTGDDVDFASSGLLVELTQPLLRGAFKQVALENLTQAERDVLYAVRSFARFRRILYVDVMSAYLNLLSQAQQIRNQRYNLLGLERSLREHEELSAAGLISIIQVDQVFQQYQGARLSLLSAQLQLQTALDRFKIDLGLPPQLEVTLDEALLRPFQLNDERLERLRDGNEALFLSLLQSDAPPPEADLRRGYETLRQQQTALVELAAEIETELVRWEEQLRRAGASQANAAGPQRTTNDPRLDRAQEQRRQVELAARLRAALGEMRMALQHDQAQAEQDLAGLTAACATDDGRQAAWMAIRELTGREFRTQVTDAFVIQSQVRVYLIQLPEFGLGADAGVDLARGNRLDLMNQRALVVDAYRKVEVAGNALLAGLEVSGSANLLTPPGTSNPLKFRSTANQYRLGVRFDAPLTRLAERNTYRAAQILYQQLRRQYMLAEDQVAFSIRSELRNLEVNRFQFEIARQTLVAAARQVDEAQITLRSGGQQTDSSVTLFLLNAYTNLLAATNGLVSGWVNYETTRMSLFRDLDWMQIDAEGRWTNGDDRFESGRRPGTEPGVIAVPDTEPIAPGIRGTVEPRGGNDPQQQPRRASESLPAPHSGVPATEPAGQPAGDAPAAGPALP
ncbi:MAG: TolC family protein [Pirellulales bacterium]|nr:TolC family protein [Pirellulales bacterium]